ncbi:MAG: TIGR03960 family B12-binding radical SAM protein [Treponema sp.]|jgi:radical SAM family uncharacterized protein|nr:TIGR03960 family B12-binding radical SAM protein [Treponema sp.]
MSGVTPIDPVRDLGAALLAVEKPARYTGGEYGRLARPGAPFQTAIAFPDLYEIGMSNQALRIIYNRLNELPGISCDRVFAPAPDFEALLRERSLPLYTLDTGVPLGRLDVLLFTLGYELGITSVLTMLDLGGIPIRRDRRGEGDPVVIMGGPCVSNPLPYAAFIDAFWIGEAEAGFFTLMEELAALKKEGRGRLLSVLARHPCVWTWGKEDARRGIDRDFARAPARAAVFPVPSMKVVQHHGAVEIMRGCPNGCRFCHAGFWYRPMRQKSAPVIRQETGDFIRKGGYREISLSSLSTGDYQNLEALVDSLNESFSGAHVSFQLPSLRVSTFSLPLLEKISRVRKSGLTFAVETPEESRQMAINKEVSLDSVTAILKKARGSGWRGAKFYFMIGLPPEFPASGESSPSGPGAEVSEAMVSFILEAARRTGLHFSINVGIFVPKPHTPYQRMPQLGLEEAGETLNRIRSRLKSAGHKVSVSDPLVSLIEGILSRGDAGTADSIEQAWASGCRLDAWQDSIRKDIWQQVLAAHPGQVEQILRGWGAGEALPWDFIKSGVAADYLFSENSRSSDRLITLPCTEKCTHPCGICGSQGGIVQNTIQNKVELETEKDQVVPGRGTWRIVFSFRKTGTAVFHAHLSVVELFSMAFLRSAIPVLYSEGFNPLPRLEIVAPLSLGIPSEAEVAAVDTEDFIDAGLFMDRLNQNLPQGFVLTRAENYVIPPGEKKHSLSSLLWGFEYERQDGDTKTRRRVPRQEEKEFRAEVLTLRPGGPDMASGGGRSGILIRDLKRLAVLARYPESPDDGGFSYFDVYRRLYPGGPA